LYVWVNPLTMWLTFATFVGYAVVYTVILKPLTPQNIVIGGASGAMPPVLGWAAIRGDVGHEAIILFLIIFLWTPPHFWALALYRVEDYRKSGLPMLPVTHGSEFTRLQILLYTFILAAACLLPQLLRPAGARDFSFFPDPPQRAVCCAAARSLPFVRQPCTNELLLNG
jgi:heme o synthase